MMDDGVGYSENSRKRLSSRVSSMRCFAAAAAAATSFLELHVGSLFWGLGLRRWGSWWSERIKESLSFQMRKLSPVKESFWVDLSSG